MDWPLGSTSPSYREFQQNVIDEVMFFFAAMTVGYLKIKTTNQPLAAKVKVQTELF